MIETDSQSHEERKAEFIIAAFGKNKFGNSLGEGGNLQQVRIREELTLENMS